MRTNLTTNGERLWDTLMQMAKIGPGIAGGNNRQTLTDADGQGRRLFQRWCEEVGCKVHVDQIGNMFAIFSGTHPDADPVAIGSHLDTQPTGGRFDGVLGVLAGLETLRSLAERGIRTKRPIAIVNWSNEEGSRFAPALLASGVYAGIHQLDWALDRRDQDNARFGDELERIGFKGQQAVSAQKMHAFLELHIEQGPILEAEGLDIGIVTHGQGLRWLEVSFFGKENHAGTTPMHLRQDAGLGIARMVELVNKTAIDCGPDAVGTVGRVQLSPGSPNVIPGMASALIDIRSPGLETLKKIEDTIKSGSDQIANELGLEASFKVVEAFDPITFDPQCVEILRQAAIRQGYRYRDLVSGAGHDACMISKVVPTAMIMCPCVDGLSHNEAEDIKPQWAKAGADVLLQAALELAGVDQD